MCCKNTCENSCWTNPNFCPCEKNCYELKCKTPYGCLYFKFCPDQSMKLYKENGCWRGCW